MNRLLPALIALFFVLSTPALAQVGAGQIKDGAVTVSKISATGTASSTTFLRGDGAWAAIGSGSAFLQPVTLGALSGSAYPITNTDGGILFMGDHLGTTANVDLPAVASCTGYVYVFTTEGNATAYRIISTDATITGGYPKQYTGSEITLTGSVDQTVSMVSTGTAWHVLSTSNDVKSAQISFTGDGSTTAFNWPSNTTIGTSNANVIGDPTSVVVSGAVQSKTGAGSTDGWSMSYNDTSNYWTITFTTAPASGAAIVIGYLTTNTQS